MFLFLFFVPVIDDVAHVFQVQETRLLQLVQILTFSEIKEIRLSQRELVFTALNHHTDSHTKDTTQMLNTIKNRSKQLQQYLFILNVVHGDIVVVDSVLLFFLRQVRGIQACFGIE